MIDGAGARALVARIGAHPRPAGSEEERRVRMLCAELLADAGFTVRHVPFEYSTFAGRWATPLAGWLMLAVIGTSTWLMRRGDIAWAASLLLAAAAAGLVAGAVAARSGVLRLPLARARSTNLVAVRGEPVAWLAAHLDTKSQPIPMLARIGGIIVAGACWIALTAFAVVALIAARSSDAILDLWSPVAAIGAAAGILVALSTVGARSPGAVDNASGVAAVLSVARAAPVELPLGVLLSSAEELGLAGARAFVAAGRPAGEARAVNFDGLDDGGLVVVMTHGRTGVVAAAARRAADILGTRVRVGRGLPGVLTDGVALRDGGWDVVTIASGTLGTLARIHSPRDTAARLRGDGIAAAAALALVMLEEMP